MRVYKRLGRSSGVGCVCRPITRKETAYHMHVKTNLRINFTIKHNASNRDAFTWEQAEMPADMIEQTSPGYNKHRDHTL